RRLHEVPQRNEPDRRPDRSGRAHQLRPAPHADHPRPRRPHLARNDVDGGGFLNRGHGPCDWMPGGIHWPWSTEAFGRDRGRNTMKSPPGMLGSAAVVGIGIQLQSWALSVGGFACNVMSIEPSALKQAVWP